MSEYVSNVSDAEIKVAFANTNFGVADHRTLLAQSVLKRLVGYYTGHTITNIMLDLGLLGRRTHLVTKKGKEFVAHAFHDLMLKGG